MENMKAKNVIMYEIRLPYCTATKIGEYLLFAVTLRSAPFRLKISMQFPLTNFENREIDF